MSIRVIWSPRYCLEEENGATRSLRIVFSSCVESLMLPRAVDQTRQIDKRLNGHTKKDFFCLIWGKRKVDKEPERSKTGKRNKNNLPAFLWRDQTQSLCYELHTLCAQSENQSQVGRYLGVARLIFRTLASSVWCTINPRDPTLSAGSAVCGERRERH